MKNGKRYWAGLVAAFGLASQAWAQPAVPAVPAVPGAPAVAAPAAPARNIWSMILLTPEQRANCKDRWCKHPLGQMVSGMAGPMSAMSGGLIQNKCALPSAAELAKPADSAEGAAAKIKQDEADAKARREAVRYLGTVDCHYWPEAQDALINALRGDRNECVRFEAALALQRGCCCTKKVMEALAITVSGSEKDGFPSETSDRVRAAAADALGHCSMVFQQVSPANPTENKLPEPKRVQVNPADYYKQVTNVPQDQIAANARQALSQANVPTTPSRLRDGTARTRASQGLVGILANAASPKNAVGNPAQTQEPVTVANQPVPAPVQVPASVTPVQASTSSQENSVQAPVTPAVQTTPVQEAQPEQLPVNQNQVRYPHPPQGLINILAQNIRARQQRQTQGGQPAAQEQMAPLSGASNVPENPVPASNNPR